MSRPRRYDHDEARRLYGEGVSVRELSARFGVSEYSIRYAVVPGEADKIRERQKESSLRKGNVCIDCGKPIHAARGIHQTTRPYKRCQACASAARRIVTDNEMRCSSCKQWKPDSEFFSSAGLDARRGHDRRCKTCSVKERRERRHRNRRPCINGCGAMVNSPRDNNNRGTGMCLKCVRKQRAKTS